MNEFLDPQRDLLYLLGRQSSLPGASPEDLAWIQQAGLLYFYQEEASPQAIDLLLQTAAHSPFPLAAQQSLKALAFCSGQKNQAATDALYTLAIDFALPAAAEIIPNAPLEPADPLQARRFELLYQPLSRPFTLPQLLTFAQAYQEASPAVQQRILQQAPPKGLADWAAIVSKIFFTADHGFPHLVQAYATLPEPERCFMLAIFRQQAQHGSLSAQEALCSLFLKYADQQARADCLEGAYLPADLIQRAGFLFLTEQWESYKDLDFNHSLLIGAFRQADVEFRRRLLAQSRRFGLVDWFKSVDVERQSRWIGNFSDSEWGVLLQELLKTERYADLWRIAVHSSPVRCAQILEILRQRAWAPEAADEQSGFAHLSQVAALCQTSGFVFSAPTRLRTNLPDLTCLALSAEDLYIAAGSSGPLLRIWKCSPGFPQVIDLSSPVNAIRAIAFSPELDTLACSCGDNRIRVFRLKDGQIIKTLEGHTGLIRALSIAPGARWMTSASFDGSIRYWRYPLGPEMAFYQAPHEQFSLTMPASADLMISAGAGSRGYILRSPEATFLSHFDHPSDTVTHLATSRQLNSFAAGGRDHWIQVWNHPSGQVLREMKGAESPLMGLALHPTEPVGFSASLNTITIWNLSNGDALFNLSVTESSISNIFLNENGNLLVCGLKNGQVLFWDLETWMLTRLPVENTLPRQITQLEQKKKQGSLSSQEKHWIDLFLELNQWLRRYDILIEEPLLQVGEFDIQL